MVHRYALTVLIAALGSGCTDPELLGDAGIDASRQDGGQGDAGRVDGGGGPTDVGTDASSVVDANATDGDVDSSMNDGGRPVLCTSSPCECDADTECFFRCDVSPCRVNCDDRTICHVDCPLGNCTIDCADDATCDVSCGGGDCTNACADAMDCSLTCGTGSECVRSLGCGDPCRLECDTADSCTVER